jgi:hypothetical protein
LGKCNKRGPKIRPWDYPFYHAAFIKKIAEKTEEIEKLDGNIEKEQQKKRRLLEEIQSPAATVRNQQLSIKEEELADCKEKLTLLKTRREKAETLKDKFEEELYLYQKHTEN